MPFPSSAGPGALAGELAGPRIHLWAVPLNPPAARVDALARLLTHDERERAARFRFDVHRRRFIVGRGVLRELIAAYLGRDDPAGLVFEYGPKGKPALAGPPPPGGELEFNLSNSEELALVGFNRLRPIGVDVEHLRPLDDLREIASRFFSRAESEVLLGLPLPRQQEGFFNCWTRKEAYLKAVGDGLSAPLDRFDVTLAPGDPPRMLALEGSAEKAADWRLYHLEPAPGYLGAVAIQGEAWELTCRTLS